MRFEDDPDVSGWQVSPGRAPGLSSWRLVLFIGAGVVLLVGYLLLPLDRLTSALVGAREPSSRKPTRVAGSGPDMRALNGLADHYVPKPLAQTARLESPPPAPVPDDSVLKGLQERYAQLQGLYDELQGRLNEVLNQPKPAPVSAPSPPRHAPAPTVKTVDPEAQRRAEEAKRKREARLKSEPVFLTRPPEEVVGQVHPLKSPYSLAPSEEIPCETTMTISSETPGAFVAIVSQDVPDTATRRLNVIPKGSKFVLKPTRGAIFGESRINIQAHTLTFPSGPWMKLPGSTVMDRYGTAGFTGDIDRHLLRNYGAIILTGVLRGGTTIMAGGAYGGSPSERMGAYVVQDAGAEMSRDMRQFMRTDPTITVPARYTCRLLLEEELVLSRSYPWTP